MDSGVLIDVVGEDSHPMVIALKTFLKNLGQLHVLSAEEKSGLDKVYFLLYFISIIAVSCSYRS